MSTAIHTLHVVLAGVWLGGVIFTTIVVSPALKAMKWREAERVEVRSVIGKQYARVGSVNLVLLLIFAVLDGLFEDFGTIFHIEYVLLTFMFGLVAAHGAYFGRRLVKLAEAEKRSGSEEGACTFAEKRHNLQKISLWVSWVDIIVSLAILALAANA
jgi:uncharacterized membrane protein